MTSTSLEELESAIMQLAPPERVRLLERLLASVDQDDEVLASWIVEAERRADALAAGRSHAIPVEEALRSARASLRSEISL